MGVQARKVGQATCVASVELGHRSFREVSRVWVRDVVLDHLLPSCPVLRDAYYVVQVEVLGGVHKKVALALHVVLLYCCSAENALWVEAEDVSQPSCSGAADCGNEIVGSRSRAGLFMDGAACFAA